MGGSCRDRTPVSRSSCCSPFTVTAVWPVTCCCSHTETEGYKREQKKKVVHTQPSQANPNAILIHHPSHPPLDAASTRALPLGCPPSLLPTTKLPVLRCPSHPISNAASPWDPFLTICCPVLHHHPLPFYSSCPPSPSINLILLLPFGSPFATGVVAFTAAHLLHNLQGLCDRIPVTPQNSCPIPHPTWVFTSCFLKRNIIDPS